MCVVSDFASVPFRMRSLDDDGDDDDSKYLFPGDKGKCRLVVVGGWWTVRCECRGLSVAVECQAAGTVV